MTLAEFASLNAAIRGGDLIAPQGGDERRRSPVTMRNLAAANQAATHAFHCYLDKRADRRRATPAVTIAITVQPKPFPAIGPQSWPHGADSPYQIIRAKTEALSGAC